MRAVIQRVSRARVLIDGAEVSAIGPGLVVLLGIASEDGPREAAWMAGKLARLRIFADEDGAMNLSVKEAGGEMLVVSQFTLLGDARKGNRPSFAGAAQPAQAKELYLQVVKELTNERVPVKTGEFGAMMEVELTNEGPVTIILETVR